VANKIKQALDLIARNPEQDIYSSLFPRPNPPRV
jgi:hypothetical protein